jgi:hypothetical protein
MPKRTNAFQTVIFLLQSHLAGETTVTHSEELTDLVTGDRREVDVCIRATVAGYEILIGVECRDHARMQTVEWVEQMRSKHENLPTDHLVLVSSSGFRPAAIRKATQWKIETIATAEFTEERAAEIGLRVSTVRLGTLRIEAVTKVLVTIDAVNEPITVPPDMGAIPVFNEAGEPLATINDLVAMIVREPMLRSRQPAVAQLPDGTFSVALNADNPTFIYGEREQALYMRYPSGYSPTLSRLHQFCIWCVAEHASSAVPWRHGQYKDVVYSWGESELNGAPVVLLATPDSSGSVRFSIGEMPTGPRARAPRAIVENPRPSVVNYLEREFETRG